MKQVRIPTATSTSIDEEMETKCFKAWANIKQQCYEKKNPQYKNFGAKGTQVSDDWVHNFNKFVQDVGVPTSTKMSFNLIDPDGNYEYGNVAWNVSTEIKGETV